MSSLSSSGSAGARRLDARRRDCAARRRGCRATLARRRVARGRAAQRAATAAARGADAARRDRRASRAARSGADGAARGAGDAAAATADAPPSERSTSSSSTARSSSAKRTSSVSTQQLLLAALPEARLELGDRLQHAQQIGGGERDRGAASSASRARSDTSVARAAEHDGELRAQHVGEAGEEAAEIDARFGEPRDRREDVGGAPLGDDVEERDELVFGHEAERVAHALGRHACRRPSRAPGR